MGGHERGPESGARMATIIADLSYNEAMELAYFGAQGDPSADDVSGQSSHSIPIWIRNTFNTAARGSRIGLLRNPSGHDGIKGVTSIDAVALVNLEGCGA